jgi:hypothetical protein
MFEVAIELPAFEHAPWKGHLPLSRKKISVEKYPLGRKRTRTKSLESDNSFIKIIIIKN